MEVDQCLAQPSLRKLLPAANAKNYKDLKRENIQELESLNHSVSNWMSVSSPSPQSSENHKERWKELIISESTMLHIESPTHGDLLAYKHGI